MSARRAVAFALALSVSPGLLSAAVLVLSNGDRITGKITLRGKTTIRVKTEYGTITVPRRLIATVHNDDGTTETLNAPPSPPPTPAPAPPELELTVRGDAFWYAWDPKVLPPSTAVGLRVRLDDAVLATYSDEAVDPQEIKGAIVNAFAFTQDVVIDAGAGITATAPVKEGGAVLRLRLPPGTQGGRLRVSYVVQPTADGDPVEVASGTVPVRFTAGTLTSVTLRQARGDMEWSKKRMQKVETFAIIAESVSEEQ